MGISAARLRVLTSVLAACLYTGVVQATPNNGFGVYLGALSSSDSSLYGNSHGGLIAVDTQFMVDDHWSLNPYLLFDSESTSHSFDISTGEGGLQARYWMGGSLYVGGQFLFHDTLFKRSGTVGTSLYGPGIGVGVGWESDSHWSVALATNAYRLTGTYGSAASNRSEAMLLIGYHWY
ncbi:MAG TPA: hypothetical protein VGM47_08670 [Gammaproteobacteria bacterium]